MAAAASSYTSQGNHGSSSAAMGAITGVWNFTHADGALSPPPPTTTRQHRRLSNFMGSNAEPGGNGVSGDSNLTGGMLRVGPDEGADDANTIKAVKFSK